MGVFVQEILGAAEKQRESVLHGIQIKTPENELQTLKLNET